MNRPVRFALGGLETGVSGALAMLAWLAGTSLWYQRTAWWVPNLFGAVFYGEASLRYGFARYTAAGIALELFIYGLIGSFFGLAWRDRPGGGKLLWAGILVALGVWYLLFRVLWKNLNPLASLYSPDRQLLIGNLIYGLVLARFPKSVARLSSEPETDVAVR